jgi:hypothetical protein
MQAECRCVHRLEELTVLSGAAKGTIIGCEHPVRLLAFAA